MTRGIRYENFALNTLQLIELDENIRIRNGIIEMLAGQMDCNQANITGQTLIFAELGISERAIDKLIIGIKDAYDVMIFKRDFRSFMTVNDLISFVREKYRGKL